MNEERSDLPKDVTEALSDCEEEVDHLKRENRLLREASRSFGALAERLNASLAAERRQGHERRAVPRVSADRRHAAAVADRPED
jgi:hypothetical protein